MTPYKIILYYFRCAGGSIRSNHCGVHCETQHSRLRLYGERGSHPGDFLPVNPSSSSGDALCMPEGQVPILFVVTDPGHSGAVGNGLAGGCP